MFLGNMEDMRCRAGGPPFTVQCACVRVEDWAHDKAHESVDCVAVATAICLPYLQFGVTHVTRSFM